jgi:hypothetical protein
VCPYARLFEPFAANGPSGLRDRPRPFVFRAAHLNGTSYQPGAVFHFDVNLFDTSAAVVEALISAFAELAREGLGPQRRSVELIEVAEVGYDRNPFKTIYEHGSAVAGRDLTPLVFPLMHTQNDISRVSVRFLTATELKSGEQLAPVPEFGILACRIRDRVSILRLLYGDGPLNIDFQSFGERASRVKMTRCDITNVSSKRRSSRTGQVHPLGGVTGEVEYEGDLAEFVPYLTIAKWTGVGRQTVWGKGEIDVEIIQ